VIEYCPNAELERIWRPITSKLPYVFMVTMLMGLVLGSLNLLDPLVIALATVLILPFKGFLMAESTGAAALAIGVVSTASGWIFAATGVAIGVFAIRRAELPNRIGYNEMNLMLTQAHGSGTYQDAMERQYVCRSIPWKEVTSVTVNRPKGTKSVNDYRLRIEWTVKNTDGSRNVSAIFIKYGDIWKPSERDTFLRLLKSQLPATVFRGSGGALSPPERHLMAEAVGPLCGYEVVGPDETFSVFKPAKSSENFTELWLKELSAPSTREKLAPLEAGAQLQKGEYTVERKLGTGGQATVYLAKHFQSAGNAQSVALKEFVMPVFPDARVRKSVAEKFQQEAAMLSRLAHPQIVKLLDVFVEDHRAYLVLERIQGNTLKGVVIQRGVLFEGEVAKLALQMCDILLYLHNQNPPVIHRDFTPDNLMLYEGKLFLIDFSVAQQIEINITGSVVGKHLYMAPEQFRGKASPQSDVYSFGATLFYLLTGKEPEAISVSHPRAIEPGISEQMDTLIAECTALDTASRPADLSAVKARIASTTVACLSDEC